MKLLPEKSLVLKERFKKASQDRILDEIRQRGGLHIERSQAMGNNRGGRGTTRKA
jgi:hypothetical protein